MRRRENKGPTKPNPILKKTREREGERRNKRSIVLKPGPACRLESHLPGTGIEPG